MEPFESAFRPRGDGMAQKDKQRGRQARMAEDHSAKQGPLTGLSLRIQSQMKTGAAA
ncbi:hypothetical protein HMPREF0004_3122 [Achromobacter piechaudii ATCC 43553]|uniref:Uncharacterized protein n=1 Tax=Achromobacter piechaudii ATCC 43553 TaxID=742159 RepID=D4XCC5_9BURK|nr:hypothetical protein HMPREF0004_3122 [Achromobacter piechaudii ATCC 43553]